MDTETVTVEDCVENYRKGKVAILNDGKLVGFTVENSESK